MKKTLLVTFAILFSLVSFCNALETDTHEVINEYIARNELNGFSLDSYLKDQLNIDEGIEESFDSNKAWWWLKKGGKYEDKPSGCIPYWRSLRHFHNPLTDQGLKGTLESSIQWSQKPAGTQSCGYYSWHDVRGYFYNALTSSAKTERDEKFAQTFRGIGQLMHLVQDLSVPAHTRDDTHILYNYEKWAKGKIKKTDDISENYLPLIFYDPPIGDPNPLAAVPVANLFDTNQYIDSNPGITLQGNIGLSEYTNANFFSLDTVFKDFPYPSRDSVSLDDVAIPDPRYPSGTILRKYFNKMRDGDTGYRLATVSFLQGFEDECAPFCSEWFNELAALDGKVYGDYAEKLIPRAVGYSVGLLNFFFRGEINMVPDEENGNGFIIKNNSDEELEGIFRLYYDNESDQRIQIENGSFPLEITIPGNDKSSNINFTIPDNSKEPGKYTLVFRGKLGNEEDAVVGKIVDINPYLLITIDGGADRAICFVWNIIENKYAHVLDADSYPISFPCSKSELTTWLSDSYSVGESLFDSLPGCDNTRLDVDCDTPNGCWDHNGECTDEVTRASSCVDADGSPLLNATRIARSDVAVCHGAPYCADANRSLQKQITTEGACYGGIRSMRLAARNNSGIVTSVRTKEEYNQNYTKHYSDDGSGCYEMGLAYFSMDELIESKYTIFTPIGELINYNLSQENYALWNYFVDLGQGNQTDESMKSSGYGVYGLYYGNVMVQLYYYDYLKKIETRPCGQIPWLGWVPWDYSGPNDIPCDYDSIEYDDTLFSVCAQADVLNDPDNQDPTHLSRNNGLEGAIHSLREKFENEYGNSSGDTLTNYIISIDLRIEKSVLQ